MAEVILRFRGFQCERCGHQWVKRGEGAIKTCPRCRSPYWDSPRKPPKARVNDRQIEGDR